MTYLYLKLITVNYHVFQCLTALFEGTWEHRQRKLEMEKTAREAAQSTQMMEAGRHHIGDFLPPEELNKFMNKYKVY